VSDVHCKIQTRPLVREGALLEEENVCQTKEHVKSGHGPQRAARHQDILADRPSVANSTPFRVHKLINRNCILIEEWRLLGCYAVWLL
jgi:hypothetical protein